MITYILIFTLIAFIYVTVYLLKVNKKLRSANEVLKENNAMLSDSYEDSINKNNYIEILENEADEYDNLVAKQAVKITELQTKLDMYNGEH